MKRSKTVRIALSGGPGGGKSTAALLFQKELGRRAVVVPEAATILFGGGFPRSGKPAIIKAAQRAIFQIQRSLEAAHEVLEPGRIHLCDRGTVDGAAYWPGSTRHYFDTLHTTFEAELARYDAVIFFESAALGRNRVKTGNAVRNESRAAAVRLDAKLRRLWSRHPRFFSVPAQRSFDEKMAQALGVLRDVIE